MSGASGPATGSAGGFPLVEREAASPEVLAIYADIEHARGANGLTQTWRFFAQDPQLLRSWWELTSRLEAGSDEISPELMHAIAIVCAADVGCPRCFNSHQAALVTRLGLAPELAQALPHFEETDQVRADWKPVLRLARRVAFGEPASAEDVDAVRALGYSDRGLIEITSIAMLEGALARRSLAVGHLEQPGLPASS